MPHRFFAGRARWPAPFFFRRRRLMCGAIMLVCGVMVSPLLRYAPWIWVVPGALLLAALGLSRISKGRTINPIPINRVAAALLLAGLFALGAARGAMELSVPEMPQTGRWSAEGTVDGPVARAKGASWFFLRDVVITAADGETRAIDSKLYCYSAASAAKLFHGQRVTVSGTSYLPEGARNPGGFDTKRWLEMSGAHVRMYLPGAPKITMQGGFSLTGTSIAISESLGERMDALFGEASPVIRAMLLGDQAEVPDQWSGWLRDSGIIHLLSVSGLHVGLWFAMLSLLLRPIPLSQRARWVLLALLLAGYAMLTGLKPSILRATILLLCVQGAHVARRKADPLTALSVAAGLILLFRPLDLFGASFQMSFCAVLGIVLLQPPLRRLLRLKSVPVADSLAVTVSAQLGVLPALAGWFGKASLIGVLTNLAAVPLSGILIPAAAGAMLLSEIWPPLSWFLVQASRGLVAAILWIARISSEIPYAVIRVGAFSPWVIVAVFGSMLLASTATVWRWRTRFVSIALLFSVAIGITFLTTSHAVRYVQLDVGEALSGVLHANNRVYVYDCGNPGSDLTEYLLYHGAGVDGLFLSHPHEDHIGGLAELLDAGIPVKTVYVPVNADAFGAESDYRPLLLLAQAKGATIVELAAGDTLTLGGLTFDVLAPDKDAAKGNDPNDRSIVLKVAIGEYTLLLCGDADGITEPSLSGSDVVQVAHHGSRAAADENALNGAMPKVALISVGRNSYGHPNADTVERLMAAGANVFPTQDFGALTVYFERDELKVEAYCQ